jgi:hypothetical protein
MTVQYEDIENAETGPPPLAVEQLTRESMTVPHEEIENAETGPPPIEEPLLEPTIKFAEVPITEPVKFSWFSYLWWIVILLLFVILSIYYAFKLYANKKNYIIKINANKFQLSLDNLREDIEEWLLSWRDWKEDMSDYMSQFLFRQHVQNSTFKVKKYKIPKNLITPIENMKKHIESSFS